MVEYSSTVRLNTVITTINLQLLWGIFVSLCCILTVIAKGQVHLRGSCAMVCTVALGFLSMTFGLALFRGRPNPGWTHTNSVKTTCGGTDVVDRD